MARTPESVERSSVLIVKPAGETYHAGGSSHRLEPSAQSPQNCEEDEGIGKAQSQIHQGCNEQTGRHQSLDVASVSKETVGKLTDSVSEEQDRADDTELSFREYAIIYNRFFDYVQAESAHIICTISYGSRKESSPLQTFQFSFVFLRCRGFSRNRFRNLIEVYYFLKHIILSCYL